MPSPRDHGSKAVSWWSTTIPSVGPTGTTTTWVGVRFRVSVSGRIAGFRFYDGFIAGAANASQFQLFTWLTNRQPLRSAPFYWSGGALSNQWNQKWFRPWFRPVVGTDYMLAVLYVGGGFFRNNSALSSPVTHNGITFVSSFQNTSIDLSVAAISENTNANAVDVLFYPD